MLEFNLGETIAYAMYVSVHNTSVFNLASVNSFRCTLMASVCVIGPLGWGFLVLHLFSSAGTQAHS